jgi:dihydrofolate reductase
MEIKMIVAIDQVGGIGVGGELPWTHSKKDMVYFKKVTTGGEKAGVLMGRKTWDSIPAIHRPLPDRENFVLSSTMKGPPGCVVCSNVVQALIAARSRGVTTLWIIGGSSLYERFVGLVTEIHVTRMNIRVEECDTFFPVFLLEEFYSKVDPPVEFCDDGVGAPFITNVWTRN